MNPASVFARLGEKVRSDVRRDRSYKVAGMPSGYRVRTPAAIERRRAKRRLRRRTPKEGSTGKGVRRRMEPASDLEEGEIPPERLARLRSVVVVPGPRLRSVVTVVDSSQGERSEDAREEAVDAGEESGHVECVEDAGREEDDRVRVEVLENGGDQCHVVETVVEGGSATTIKQCKELGFEGEELDFDEEQLDFDDEEMDVDDYF